MTPTVLALLPCAIALAPVGFIAEGVVVAAVIARLKRGGRGLAGVVGDGIVVVLAVDDDAERLPWVDGVRYIGREPTAPSLLLPTTRALNVPASWAAAAIATTVAPPLLVLEDRIVPLSTARRLDGDDGVLAWLEAR
jgi:hypothetical protein